MKLQKDNRGKTWLIITLSIVGALIAIILIFVIGVALSSNDEAADAATEQTEETFADDIDYEDEEQSYELSDEEAIAQTGADGTWTIMIHMCGSDLESDGCSGTYNMAEILWGEPSDKVNVVVQTGGSKKWNEEGYIENLENCDDIANDSLGYYRLTDGKVILEKSEPLASMGEPDTLSSFIKWGAEKYPADKYMLILWDHGGGTTGGVCYDELYEDDRLTLPEIRKALDDADVPFENITFDACLMATLETAETLQGYAHYMTASEEIVPGAGIAYTEFIQYLNENPGSDGYELGKVVVDAYNERYVGTGKEDMVTMSVTDLTKLPAVSSAYRNLSGQFLISTQDADKLNRIQQGAGKAENYGGNNDAEGYTNLVDLKGLVENTKSAVDADKAEAVTDALEQAVLYERHGDGRMHSNGMSVFYPLQMDEDTVEKYKNSTNDVPFAGYMTALCGEWDEKAWEEAWKETASQTIAAGKYDSYFNGGQQVSLDYTPFDPDALTETVGDLKPVQKGNYKIEAKQVLEDTGELKLKITSGLEAVTSVCFEIVLLGDDGDSFLYLGSDNTLECDYNTGEFKDMYSGSWMTIGDEYVCAYLTEEGEGYNLYTIPVKLNGKEMFLKSRYDSNTGKYKILGAYEGFDSETGQGGRDVQTLKAGDKVTFMFMAQGSGENTEPEWVDSETITWSDSTIMEDVQLNDCSIGYIFTITDMFGNETSMNPVMVDIKDGKMSYYEPES